MEYKEEQSRIAVYNDSGAMVGELTWVESGDSLIFDHTYVGDSLRGQGIAEEMLRMAVERAAGLNLDIIPLCPYVKREFERNPEYQKHQAGKR